MYVCLQQHVKHASSQEKQIYITSFVDSSSIVLPCCLLYHHTIYNSFYSSSNTVSAKSSFLSLCRPEDEKFWGDSTGVTGRGGAEGIDSVTEP